MEQKTTLSQSIEISVQKELYDEVCKKVLAEKIILAWIMKHAMKEYADYEVREIVENFIVGEPKVAKTKVLPDATNAPRISGTGVEYMCNLSDGVEQKGIQKGIEQANRLVVINMLKENDPIDKICRIAGCDEDYVKKVQEELDEK